MSTMNQRRLHPMARLSWPLGHVFGTARCLQKPRETHQLRELHLWEATDTSDITDWKDDPHPDCNFEFGRQCWRFFFKNLEFESESFWRSLACDAFYNQMKRAQSGGNPQKWNDMEYGMPHPTAAIHLYVLSCADSTVTVLSSSQMETCNLMPVTSVRIPVIEPKQWFSLDLFTIYLFTPMIHSRFTTVYLGKLPEFTLKTSVVVG